MSLIGKLQAKWKAKRDRKALPHEGVSQAGTASSPPIIDTPWGPTTESARHRAALNMKEDPSLRSRVEELLIGRAGGDQEKGLAEARRRYREAYEDDDKSS